MSKEAMTTGNEQQANDETNSFVERFENAELSETNNQQPATENMEVHHHTHAHGNKNWKTYVWEFLMLFLAVFCGFLAEYQLEHVIEHQREKEYIKSFTEDLKADAVQLKEVISTIDTKLLYRDSLFTELSNPAVFSNSARAYYYTSASFHFPDFIYNDRTIQQLKNSGGMRLIRNKTVSDGIMAYDAKVRIVFIAQQQMNAIALTDGYQISKIFRKRLLVDTTNNPQRLPVPLLTQNKVDLEEFYNNMKDQELGFTYLKQLDVDLLANNLRLINLIQKEYHLEHE